MKEKARRNSDKNDDEKADGVNKLVVMRVIGRHKKTTQ